MVTLGRVGLGARTGFGFLVVAGDGIERPSLLGVAGDRPGFGKCRATFGFGATGGF